MALKTYRVYHHPVNGYEAVKEGYSWPGLFFVWIWAFVKRMPGRACMIMLAMLFVSYADNILIMSGQPWGGDFKFIGFVIIHLVVGGNGNYWRIRSLANRGYREIDILTAQSPDDAIAKAAER